MPQPKKVAIIGSGPSGLVTAKTLLHDYPTGTFAPVIFEKRHEVGGLWPNSPTTTATNDRKLNQNGHTVGPLNPFMRTNLSRFTVSFADLAWESVLGGADGDGDVDAGIGAGAVEGAMFPQAWQVGRYLGSYAERFLRRGIVRFGRTVVRTVRGEEGRWMVQWVTESDDKNEEVQSEDFDFLVVASGYFSLPHIPDIPGLGAFEKSTIHSSSLHNADDVQHLLQRSNTTGGKLVVIGGSMSGAEAASTLALHLSSSNLTADSKQPRKNDYHVHHICTRPFWNIPTYLPQEIPDASSLSSPGEKKISFVPLDLAMYDLSRRPPGPIEYAFGPLTSDKAKKANSYLFSLLGSDYGGPGKVRARGESVDEASQPPWVAIGNDYTEYVRSGAVTTTIGRVSAVHSSGSGSRSGSDLASIDIHLPGGQTETLDDVAAVVFATGFTPYHSLSFLPDSVLSALKYSENDPFFPLILDGKGTTNAAIPDLAFVGFYRGPYWGVMEMQARHIANNWANANTQPQEPELKRREEERRALQNLRYMKPDPHLHRSQFPMGDYMGLMESSARELGIPRAPLTQINSNNEEDRSGPVLPARYASTTRSPSTNETAIKQQDNETTLHSLRSILSPHLPQFNNTTPSAGAGAGATTAISMAVFRALHGKWKFTRTYQNRGQSKPNERTRNDNGSATFHPRYPTSPGYEKEYFYYEKPKPNPAETETNRERRIYRFHVPDSSTSTHTHTHTPCILVWSDDLNPDITGKDPNTAAHGLNFSTTTTIAKENEGSILGGYTVHASHSHLGEGYEYSYAFHFQGVSILYWTLTAVKINDRDCSVKTVYVRE